MNRQIRQSVFETNSSSVHSVTISDRKLESSKLKIQDKLIEVPVDEFGWSYYGPIDQLVKLSYLVMMALETEGHE